jgi:hypothetical protein
MINNILMDHNRRRRQLDQERRRHNSRYQVKRYDSVSSLRISFSQEEYTQKRQAEELSVKLMKEALVKVMKAILVKLMKKM